MEEVCLYVPPNVVMVLSSLIDDYGLVLPKFLVLYDYSNCAKSLSFYSIQVNLSSLSIRLFKFLDFKPVSFFFSAELSRDPLIVPMGEFVNEFI